MGLLQKIFGSYSEKELKRIQPQVDKVLALEERYTAMSDQELRGQTALLKERLAGVGECAFAQPAFSADNACGDAILGWGADSWLTAPLSPFLSFAGMSSPSWRNKKILPT